MKIFGVEIDFVNLRAETYAENSRIPVMVLAIVGIMFLYFEYINFSLMYFEMVLCIVH